MIVELRELTPEEMAAAEIEWQKEAAVEAERKALVDACKAEHGHAWELHLYHPEDDVHVDLQCEHCPAGINDIFTDGHELIYLELDDGVTIDEGRHNSPVALIVPVTVEVWSSESWTDYGWEYDAGLEFDTRGAARPMFPEAPDAS